MSSPFPAMRTVKTYVVTPRPNPQAPRQLHLSIWDIAMLSTHYIQKGLLFKIPSYLSVEDIIEQLRSSLEEALFHFYPLSGRMRAVKCEGGGVTCHVEVGCEGEGAQFVHVVGDGIGIADVVTTDGQDLPVFLREFFPLNLAVNFDGCTNPLLAIQVTELIDGIFIGCALNHVIGDGTSFWMFFNAWAEIARCKAAGKEVVVSQLPIHDKWFIGGYGEPPIKLPYSSPEEFVVRYAPPPLRERMFHFSSETLAELKARANQECSKGASSMVQSGVKIGVAPNTTELSTKDPRVSSNIPRKGSDTTENPSPFGEITQTTANDTEDFIAADLPSQFEGGQNIKVQGNDVANGAASSIDKEQESITHRDVRQGPQNIFDNTTNCPINVMVQSLPITTVSPKEKSIFQIGEGSKIPRIMLRTKDTKEASCFRPVEISKEKEPSGPRLIEPTRLEKKRLLQESTKQKRKLRDLLQKEKQDSSSNKNMGIANLSIKKGMIDVQVDFEHCSRIAEVSGFHSDQVTAALEKDNKQRANSNWHPEELELLQGISDEVNSQTVGVMGTDSVQ